MMKSRHWRYIVACLYVILALPMMANADAGPCQTAIVQRLGAVADAARRGDSLDAFVDPNLSIVAKQKATEFYHPPYSRFEILVRPEGVQCSITAATSDVEVGWNTETESYRGTATVQWVNRSGEWYIERVSGMTFPWVFFIALFGVTISYAAVGLTMFFHARKHHLSEMWLALSFVPPVWIVYWYRKPWLHAKTPER